MVYVSPPTQTRPNSVASAYLRIVRTSAPLVSTRNPLRQSHPRLIDAATKTPLLLASDVPLTCDFNILLPIRENWDEPVINEEVVLGLP